MKFITKLTVNTRVRLRIILHKKIIKGADTEIPEYSRMVFLTRGVITMQALILLQSLVVMVAAGTLPPHARDSQRHLLPANPEDILENNNNVASDRPNPKFFQNMVNANHELTAVESHQKTSEFQPSAVGPFHSVSGKSLVETQGSTATGPEDPQEQKVFLVVVPDFKRSKKTHHRQKRFISPKKLRIIAVPLSVFNFLGFLPVRVPGLPYHRDLPPPDYTYYNTQYEIYNSDDYKYF